MRKQCLPNDYFTVIGDVEGYCWNRQFLKKYEKCLFVSLAASNVTSLQSNAIFHWRGANLESALSYSRFSDYSTLVISHKSIEL